MSLGTLPARSRVARVCSVHLFLILLCDFIVYAYRDIWPLMTYTLEPKDGAEGNLLWAKLALTALVGFVLPVFEPYPYVPYDPTVRATAGCSAPRD